MINLTVPEYPTSNINLVDTKLTVEFLTEIVNSLNIKPVPLNIILNNARLQSVYNQFRFPKSKKKRIKNKWKKNINNWKYTETVLKDKDQNVFYVSNKLFNDLKNKYKHLTNLSFVDGDYNKFSNKYFEQNFTPLSNDNEQVPFYDKINPYLWKS